MRDAREKGKSDEGKGTILAYPRLSWHIPGYPGQSWHILANPGLSWPILGYPRLARPILACMDLSGHTLAYPGLSYAILAYPWLSLPILAILTYPGTILAHPGLSRTQIYTYIYIYIHASLLPPQGGVIYMRCYNLSTYRSYVRCRQSLRGQSILTVFVAFVYNTPLGG